MKQNQEELLPLESSLRNYFLKEKGRGINNNQAHILMKYRGLSLSLNLDNPRNPLFVVRIGGLEAHFQISDGVKVHGSLGGDERIVYQWFIFGSNKDNLTTITSKKKSKTNLMDITVDITEIERMDAENAQKEKSQKKSIFDILGF
ncbi:MAG: hypothetical protein ACI37T_05050 [Candidatus Gastranaerophilaceae bacterium]